MCPHTPTGNEAPRMSGRVPLPQTGDEATPRSASPSPASSYTPPRRSLAGLMHHVAGTFASFLTQSLLIQQQQQKEEAAAPAGPADSNQRRPLLLMRPLEIPYSSIPWLHSIGMILLKHCLKFFLHNHACRGHVDGDEKHGAVDAVQYLTVEFPPALRPQASGWEERGVGEYR